MEALENKYKVNEDSKKKFLISQYIDFKFFDEKLFLLQIHELQVIVKKMKVLKIKLLDAFQVGAIMAKLPQNLKGYQKRNARVRKVHVLCVEDSNIMLGSVGTQSTKRGYSECNR